MATRRKRTGRRSGQVMTEFAVIAAMVVGLVAMAALLLYTFKEYGARILGLVSTEFP